VSGEHVVEESPVGIRVTGVAVVVGAVKARGPRELGRWCVTGSAFGLYVGAFQRKIGVPVRLEPERMGFKVRPSVARKAALFIHCAAEKLDKTLGLVSRDGREFKPLELASVHVIVAGSAGVRATA
jgi:hypothetical protein